MCQRAAELNSVEGSRKIHGPQWMKALSNLWSGLEISVGSQPWDAAYDLINEPLHVSELCSPHVAAHFNAADHILSDFRKFPNTAALKDPRLGCKKQTFVVLPNEMLSCSSEDNTGIYMPRFLESSLRSVGWGLHRGWPTSLSLPRTHTSPSFRCLMVADTERCFVFPWGK